MAKRIQKLREQAAAPTAPPEYVELPGWTLGADSPSILTTVGPHGETVAPDYSREEYLAAVAAAVASRDFPAYVDPEASWLRFQLFRDHGEHGHYCGCPPCAAKRPAPAPPQPAAPAAEQYHDGGPRQQPDRQYSEIDARLEAERDKLRRAWQEQFGPNGIGRQF